MQTRGCKFSPPSTRIVCCRDWSNQRSTMYIYYRADLEVEGGPVLVGGGGGGGMDDSQDSHESFQNAPQTGGHLVHVALRVAIT